MANEGFTVPSQFGDGSNTPKAAVLIIIGEPSSEEHRDLILAELTKGFKSWDNEGTGVDINDELAQIANRASLGEEGPNGERLIRHGSDNVAVEILIDPQTQSVLNALKSFLVLPVPNKFLIFAGHAFKGSGDWVLQDGIFTFKKLAHILNDAEVQTALKDQPNASLTMHCLATGDWNSNISKQEFSKIIALHVNPSEKLDNVHGILQFSTYVSSFIKVRNLMDMLPASDVIGSISFNKPTLYIFPGCQGDAALFGIKGFHLLVNAGFNRKACFWDFTRHLDRIDAVLLTHLGTDNLFGINSVLKRKCLENAHPEIGYIYMNGVENTKTNGIDNGNNNSLLINLADEGSELFEMSKKLGVTPQPCTRGEKVSTLDPINLYHKVGHGSLDMYILNPVTDSKELKEFFQQWTKKVGQFGTHQGFPMPDMFSICALLVWKPTNPEEKITRVLFPGNCPQHKIIEGLEKVKNLEIFKHASCTGKDLLKPASGAKKAGAPASRTTATKATARPASAPVKKEVRKSPTRTPTKTPTTPRSSPPKTSKPDAVKKLPAKSKDTKKEKSDKSKTPSTSPSKASGASSSPAKSITPVATPVEPASPAIHAPEPAVSSAVDAVGINGLPEGLPSPDQYAALQTGEASDASPAAPQSDYSKQQLADLGIYDEDDDVGASDGGIAHDSSNSQPIGSSVDEIDENIPHNLPEPVAVPENTSVEPDLLHETSVDKEASFVQNDVLGDSVDPHDDSVDPQNILDESLQSEPDVVPHSEDPAYDIPSSPEPNFEDQDLPAIAPGRTAPLPTFTNEPDVVPSTDSFEQNIQYGVTDDSRQMGALREEDEEEVEQENPVQGADDSHDSQNMEDLGIYEDDEGSQDGNDKGDPSAIPQDKNSDFEDESIPEDEKQIGDDGIETDATGDQSNIPEAFERDTTPPVEQSTAPENASVQALNGTNGIHEDKDDTDSIDGGTPEIEKGILDTTGKLESLQESALQPGAIPISSDNPDQQFESLQSEGFNPFHGIEGGANPIPSGNGTPGSEFDPVKQWGEPMGLPSPPPPGPKSTDKSAKPKAPTKKPTTGASLDKKPTTARPSSATTKAPSKPNGVAKKPEAKKPTPSVADKKQPAAKARPATAPARTEAPKPKSAPARKPAARTSPAPVKLPPLPSLTPFYVDLTYIPNHGESNYCDVEFFKRVRARHYVLSALSPNPETLNALLEAKPSWENKDLEVMVIPTYDNETLRHWLGLNKEKLSQLKIDVAPSASRCFIQLQDHEANCSAYRLEF